MGHEVIECSLPGNQPHDIVPLRAKLPTIAQLAACDAVISFYHEYTQAWLAALYGLESWSAITDRVIARFDESMDRTDLNLPGRLPELLLWAKHCSFPAAQDAKKYGGQWQPLAADTTMFQNDDALILAGGRPEKKYGAAFVGQLYGPRLEYARRMAQHPEQITLQCGQVGVQELDGMREPESTHLLAKIYRQIKVFFCLPPLSRLIVGKVCEVMACGTFVMYPRLPGEAAANLSVFEDGKHIVYYEHGYIRENVKQIKRWLEHDEERESIARAGCRKVREELSLERMLDQLLTPVARQMVTV
jgi:glycosyltransferase involved in cell wall biosynthesis